MDKDSTIYIGGVKRYGWIRGIDDGLTENEWIRIGKCIRGDTHK